MTPLALAVGLALLVGYLAGAVTVLIALFWADRAIRKRHRLHTEEDVDAALLAYRTAAEVTA